MGSVGVWKTELTKKLPRQPGSTLKRFADFQADEVRLERRAKLPLEVGRPVWVFRIDWDKSPSQLYAA